MSEYCKLEKLGTELRCVGCEVVRIKDMIRDAVWNAGACGLVVGVSGGIDSAVVLALAVKSVGAENVSALWMPASEFVPSEDYRDAKAVCDQFGVELLTCSLSGVIKSFKEVPGFSDTPILSGNTASRLRMTMLYNVAGAKNRLVCGTSNKSEYMIGYCTKWGDSAADVWPIAHLYKTEVFIIAKDLEIPDSIMNKAPSAGFFAGQTDEAEIGLSYEELDTALAALESHEWVAENEVEKRVLAMVEKSRHKRSPVVSLL